MLGNYVKNKSFSTRFLFNSCDLQSAAVVVASVYYQDVVHSFQMRLLLRQNMHIIISRNWYTSITLRVEGYTFCVTVTYMDKRGGLEQRSHEQLKTSTWLNPLVITCQTYIHSRGRWWALAKLFTMYIDIYVYRLKRVSAIDKWRKREIVLMTKLLKVQDIRIEKNKSS